MGEGTTGGFRATKHNRPWSPPDGAYGPRSRFSGMDINEEVYQVGHSNHSDQKKFRIGYEGITWDKQEKGEDHV